MTQADLLLVAILRFALDSVLASLTPDPRRDVEDLKSEREAAAAMLTSLNPGDAIQASFAARAVTAHHAAMECFRRAAQPDVPDGLMTRLIASGMALSRMSVQLIKALEQRQSSARPATSVPSGAAAAVHAAASPAQGQLERPVTKNAGGGQDPISSERSHGSNGFANLPLNRQERRRAARQAERDARSRDTQRGVANRGGTLTA